MKLTQYMHVYHIIMGLEGEGHSHRGWYACPREFQNTQKICRPFLVLSNELHSLDLSRGLFPTVFQYYYTCTCIRELVDSLCRDGADAQYMQYLSKSRITSPQTH